MADLVDTKAGLSNANLTVPPSDDNVEEESGGLRSKRKRRPKKEGQEAAQKRPAKDKKDPTAFSEEDIALFEGMILCSSYTLLLIFGRSAGKESNLGSHPRRETPKYGPFDPPARSNTTRLSP